MSNALKEGGPWLGALRNWLKWNTHNGERVTWDSLDVIEPPMTVRNIETAGAAAVEADRVVTSARLAQAETERDEARAERDALRQTALEHGALKMRLLGLGWKPEDIAGRRRR